MFALRSARLRAAVDKCETIARARLLMSLEPLEGRVLMCASLQELVAKGVPSSMIQDGGHILQSDYATLSPELQKHIDPHWVQADAIDPKVDPMFALRSE